MITWKVVNRWGWVLTVSTVLTTLSLVPIFVERESLNWLEWFGTVGGLFILLFRPASSAGFMAAGALGLVVNMVILALVLELLLRGMSLMRKRWVVHS
jgi:hypothetical protein